MLSKTNSERTTIHRCLAVILLATAQSMIPTVRADSIGREMGESARVISNSATSVYQTTESALRNSAETITEQADSLHRSASELVEDMGQGYQNFVYDFQQGYNQ